MRTYLTLVLALVVDSVGVDKKGKFLYNNNNNIIMKFFQVAIAAVAALASLGEAKISSDKSEWKKTLNHRMKNNLYNKEVLMQGAKPHNKAAEEFEAMRKLGNNNNNKFAITSDYSIQFISCFSLTTSMDELFEDNQNGGSIALNLMSNGKAIAERSYAIFKLCYTPHCSYTGNDPSLQYVIDLSVYVQALVMYLPDQVENFCDGCQQNQESCYAQLYGGYGYAGMYGYNGQAYSQQQNQQYQYSGNNGHRRSLAGIHNAETRRLENGQVVRQLDCNLCLQYNCIEPMNGNGNWNNDVYGFEAAAEWLISISQCYQTGAVYSGNGAYYQQGGNNNQGNIYAGFLCNDMGNGVEIGLFLDEDCVLYLPNESFSNYMNLYDSTYQSMTEDIIEFTFSEAAFSCKDEEVVYTTQYVDGYSQYYNYDWNANQNADPAEWCQYLSNNELGASPVNLYDCGGRNSNYQNYQNNNNNNNYQYMYSWYQFEITEDNAIDMQQVCTTVKSQNGQLHTFYNGNNGHLYSYGSSSSSSSSSSGVPSSVSEFLEGTNNTSVSYYYKKTADSLSGTAKFGIIAGVGVAVGIVVALAAIGLKAVSSDKAEPLMHGELDEGRARGIMA
jgi:hypothetical protein